MGQTARNSEYIKNYNRKAALRILRGGAMSRAGLARAMGLTRSATSLIADELLAEGIIRELSPLSGGRGRSAIPLVVCPQAYYALAVWLTRRGSQVGLCDFAGNLVELHNIPMGEDSIDCLERELRRLLERAEPGRVLGIGVSSPGPLDTKCGRIINPPRFDRWHGVEITDILSERLGLPAHLENDASALALHQLGLGGSRDFLLLLVNSGVGSGIVTNGELLCSSRHFPSELGHTSIRFDGTRCECGNRGCLEAYTAIPNILRGSSYSSWSELVSCLDTEREAETLFRKEAAFLATGIINLLNLIHLDTVYLAGDIACSFEPLAQRLSREITRRSLIYSNASVEILPADPRPEAGILSASDIVFSNFLTV